MTQELILENGWISEIKMLGFGKIQSKNQQLQHQQEKKKKSVTVLMNMIWSIPGVKDLRNSKLADCTFFFSL